MNDKSYDESLAAYRCGMVALENAQPQEALKHFQRSNAYCEHFKTHHRIATVLRALDRDDESGEHFERAWKLNPHHSQVATDYAEFLFEHGRRDAALSIVEAVLQHNTTYGPAKDLEQRLDPS
ncbi:MAG: tetratricopeptide repeat protein [Myxococcota bacterium]